MDETRVVNPSTERAKRRVDSENRLRWQAKNSSLRASVLRIPGIYANDREGGTPRERLVKRTPVLTREDDVFTNHIQADDLARACWRALWLGKPQRIYNVTDDSNMLMGDYFDMAADLYGLPKPDRISLAKAREQLSAASLSFMGESRRLSNRRMKNELRLKLRYSTPQEGLQQIRKK